MSRSSSLRALWVVLGFLLVGVSDRSTRAETASDPAERIRQAQQLARTGAQFDLEGESKYATFRSI
jgi:hypothetical protein